MLRLQLLLDDLPERLSDVSARISRFTPPNQKIIDAAQTYVHYVCRTLVFFASHNAKSKHRNSYALKIIVTSGIYSLRYLPASSMHERSNVHSIDNISV